MEASSRPSGPPASPNRIWRSPRLAPASPEEPRADSVDQQPSLLSPGALQVQPGSCELPREEPGDALLPTTGDEGEDAARFEGEVSAEVAAQRTAEAEAQAGAVLQRAEGAEAALVEETAARLAAVAEAASVRRDAAAARDEARRLRGEAAALQGLSREQLRQLSDDLALSAQRVRLALLSAEADAAVACVVCLEAPRACLLMGCHHANVCAACAERLEACPTCRAPVEARVRIYF